MPDPDDTDPRNLYAPPVRHPDIPATSRFSFHLHRRHTSHAVEPLLSLCPPNSCHRCPRLWAARGGVAPLSTPHLRSNAPVGAQGCACACVCVVAMGVDEVKDAP